jgi:spoIIIJ-associated protein
MLHREADRAGQRAAKVKRPITLSPMSAAERRVVHDRLKDTPGVETYSEGEEPDRCVVVAPLLAE